MYDADLRAAPTPMPATWPVFLPLPSRRRWRTFVRCASSVRPSLSRSGSGCGGCAGVGHGGAELLQVAGTGPPLNFVWKLKNGGQDDDIFLNLGQAHKLRCQTAFLVLLLYLRQSLTDDVGGDGYGRLPGWVKPSRRRCLTGTSRLKHCRRLASWRTPQTRKVLQGVAGFFDTRGEGRGVGGADTSNSRLCRSTGVRHRRRIRGDRGRRRPIGGRSRWLNGRGGRRMGNRRRYSGREPERGGLCPTAAGSWN